MLIILLSFIYSKKSTSKNVALSLYFYDMFWPVISHHQVVNSLHKKENFVRTKPLIYGIYLKWSY